MKKHLMRFRTLLLTTCCLLLSAMPLAVLAYNNPFLYADAPDPDIIRVDSTFYMVSTTMHMSPGCCIMKSYDLVNWSVLGYGHDQLEELDAFALKNGENIYANGSWAANLRYDPYEKRFFLLVTCNTTEQSYMFTTTDIEHGRWHRNVVDLCYDPGLLFADMGDSCRKYIVHPDFSLDGHQVYMREIISDGEGNVTVTDTTTIIPYGNLENPAQGLRAEGAHGYKIGDYYYIFMIQGVGARRQEIVWRSKAMEPGGWEGKLVFEGDIVTESGKKYLAYTGLAQGGVVDLPDGRWYCFLFQDYGAIGRMPVLAPMTWDDDGWPVIGNNGKSFNYTYDDPIEGYEATSIVTSDEFDNGTERYYPSDTYASDVIKAGITMDELAAHITAGTLTDDVLAKNEYAFNGSILKREWQWNHNPNNNLWSLTEREGYLRLKNGFVVDNIREARNTLTQRIMGPVASATAAMETSLMKNGDVAGLVSFQNQYGFVGVKKEDGQCYITMHKATAAGDADGREYVRIPLTDERVYLRIDCDFRDMTDKACFYYSTDGETWLRLGPELQMAYDWPDFVGQRFGLFSFGTTQCGGAADFDYFHLSDTLLTDAQNAVVGSSIDHIGVDEDGDTDVDMLLGSTETPYISAYYTGGGIEDISDDVTLESSNEEVLAIESGLLNAKDEGETTLHVTYTSTSGEAYEVDLAVTVSIFPLSLINPSIYGTGTYQSNIMSLTTSTYGFGGWSYSPSIDLTGYESVSLELLLAQKCDAQLRFYDEESYWSSPACYVIGTNRKSTIELSTLVKDDGTALDLSHIYMIGFWSTGGSAIRIRSLTANKKTDGVTLAAAAATPSPSKEGIFSLSGHRLSQAERGLYIVDGQKVVMR